jgi:hypothetical protein
MSWTHYKDKLPPIGERVLFTFFVEPGSYNYDSLDDVGFWREPNIGTFNNSYNAAGSLVMDISEMDGDWEPATHWMPLPERPPIPEVTQ